LILHLLFQARQVVGHLLALVSQLLLLARSASGLRLPPGIASATLAILATLAGLPVLAVLLAEHLPRLAGLIPFRSRQALCFARQSIELTCGRLLAHAIHQIGCLAEPVRSASRRRLTLVR
jgi:hypothetical protein